VNPNWYLIFAAALASSFCLSALGNAFAHQIAPRLGLLDHPGERKIHRDPIPVMGGIVFVLSFYAAVLGGIFALLVLHPLGITWLNRQVFSFLGEMHLVKLGGIVAGSIVIFVLGIVDDVFSLRPLAKLGGQVAAAGVVVGSGVRLELFLEMPWLGSLAAMLWIVAMCNSLNLLDNMDGLCGGVSVIAALSFFLCFIQSGETFVCALLMAFAGAVAGFLYHNLYPARIFMGDAGAMFNGYMLATFSILGTFYTPEAPSRSAIAAPLLALSVPIFDTLSVMYIRWSKGESVFKGDKRHFSHRLEYFGMTRYQAVEFIFLVAVINGIGAALLPRVGLGGAMLILTQALGVFAIIVLLMNVKPSGAPRADEEAPSNHAPAPADARSAHSTATPDADA